MKKYLKQITACVSTFQSMNNHRLMNVKRTRFRCWSHMILCYPSFLIYRHIIHRQHLPDAAGTIRMFSISRNTSDACNECMDFIAPIIIFPKWFYFCIAYGIWDILPSVSHHVHNLLQFSLKIPGQCLPYDGKHGNAKNDEIGIIFNAPRRAIHASLAVGVIPPMSHPTLIDTHLLTWAAFKNTLITIYSRFMVCNIFILLPLLLVYQKLFFFFCFSIRNTKLIPSYIYKRTKYLRKPLM